MTTHVGEQRLWGGGGSVSGEEEGKSCVLPAHIHMEVGGGVRLLQATLPLHTVGGWEFPFVAGDPHLCAALLIQQHSMSCTGTFNRTLLIRSYVSDLGQTFFFFSKITSLFWILPSLRKGEGSSLHCACV